MKKVLIALFITLLSTVYGFADTLTVTTDKASYARGEVIRITAVYKNSNGYPITSPTTREVRIKNPSGVEVLRTSMTNAGSGTYTYNYTLSSTAPTGSWEIRGKFVYNNIETKTYIYRNVTSTVSDTTAPVTTASPAGGTYTSAQSVTLTRNEAGTTYYTTDGTTPTTASSVYSVPLNIAATTTLKYFSRDTAGNSEAVKTAVYTITISGGSTHSTLTWSNYAMCLSCHRTQAQAMYQSVHYQWKGAASKMTTGPAASQGKMDALDGSSALNAYCVNIMGNWGPCGACHAGTGAKPVATTAPTDAQLASIDCLMCHSQTYTRVRNATTGLFEPTVGLDMNAVVQTVGKPTRKNCLGCHAKAGGGDAVKRGDIALASATTTDVIYDTHMAGGQGGNIQCQTCHTFTNHRVAGRGSDLRPSDSTATVSCSTSTCHSTKASLTNGHSTTDVNHHVGRVACQSCHIKTYAKNANDTTATEATETMRTWETAEWNATLNRYEPLPTKANALTPKYAFWNGTSWGNNLMDAAVLDPATNAYKISRPNGAITDVPGTKLYPFKYKTARQPLDTTVNKLIGLSTATYFSTGNYQQAVLDGLANMGRTGDAWTTVTTDEYQVLNHQVAPASGNALACTDCHKSTTRINLPAMGYTLKAAKSTVCSQCHGDKSYSDYKWVHDKHVTSERYDCSRCHNFTRKTERSLN